MAGQQDAPRYEKMVQRNMSGDPWRRHPLLPLVPGTQVPEFATMPTISVLWSPTTPLQGSAKSKPWLMHGPQSCLPEKSEHAAQRPDLSCTLQSEVERPGCKAERDQSERDPFSVPMRQDAFCQASTSAAMRVPQNLEIALPQPSSRVVAGDKCDSSIFDMEATQRKLDRTFQQKMSRLRKIKERAKKNSQKGNKGTVPAGENDLEKLPERRHNILKRSALELERQYTEKGCLHAESCPQVCSPEAKRSSPANREKHSEQKPSVSPWTPALEAEQRDRKFVDLLSPVPLPPEWHTNEIEETAMSNRRCTADSRSYSTADSTPFTQDAGLVKCGKLQYCDEEPDCDLNEGSLSRSRAPDDASPTKDCLEARTAGQDQSLALSNGCNSAHNFSQVSKWANERYRGEAQNQLRVCHTGEANQPWCASSPWGCSPTQPVVKGLRSKDSDNQEKTPSSNKLASEGDFGSRSAERDQTERQGESDGGVKPFGLLAIQENQCSRKVEMLDLNLHACPEDSMDGHQLAGVADSTSFKASCATSRQEATQGMMDPSVPSDDSPCKETSRRADSIEVYKAFEEKVSVLMGKLNGKPNLSIRQSESRLAGEGHGAQALVLRTCNSSAVKPQHRRNLSLSTAAGQGLYVELLAKVAEHKSLAPFQLRFIKLQEYLVQCDLEDYSQLTVELNSMTPEERGAHAVELEQKAAVLAWDEAREVTPVKAGVVLGRGCLQRKNLL